MAPQPAKAKVTEAATPPPMAAGQIEIWKKIVDVQQHFNDLELRIRNFALIVSGAFLGLGGYAIKDGGAVHVAGLEVSVAGLVVMSAIIPVISFYFMDRLWYHRLLEGSVAAGSRAEDALTKLGYEVHLGSQISEKSPFTVWGTNYQVHSRRKMDFFYLLLVLTLLVLGIGLALGINPRPLQTLQPSTAATENGNTNELTAPTTAKRGGDAIAKPVGNPDTPEIIKPKSE